MRTPRVIIAGVSSGSGKTTAVCAILSLLKQNNADVRACKCGPDYIDPMFHRKVTGVPCAGLDPFFCDGDLLKYLLCKNAGERVTVIEGVMGYYDGTGKTGTDNSTFTVAGKTDSPVILVVDGKGSSSSILAVIEGFLKFTDDSRIKGVLLNRVSKMNYANVRRLMADRFGDKIVPVGYMPELPEDCRIPSRHLGLVTADEITDLSRRIGRTAALCRETIDINALLFVADTAPELIYKAPKIKRYGKIKLAVAYDNAFCFYYGDTLDMFREMGADIEFFSPLDDMPVPDGSDGLIIGGGYPELYADRLESNTKAKESVKKAVLSGMPVIAECGGFQYLGKELDGKEMCKALGHSSYDTGGLVRFGYVTLTSKKDGLFGAAGTELKAHEFHYRDSTDNGNGFTAKKPNGKEWECAVYTDTLYAGYPHLFLMSNISAAESFYEKCLEYKENKR